MSNVIIGIIGVILFIGLALAGALFLGPRFHDSANASKAAAIVSSIQQVQSATAMWRVQSGISHDPQLGIPNFLVPDYLRTVPRNPVNSTTVRYWDTININNDPLPDQTDEGAFYGGKYAVAVLGEGNQAKSICQAVADQTSGGAVTHYYTGDAPAASIGCYWHDLSADDANPTYVVYGKI